MPDRAARAVHRVAPAIARPQPPPAPVRRPPESFPKASAAPPRSARGSGGRNPPAARSEEHTSELQSLMRISYAVFCLTQKNHYTHVSTYHQAEYITRMKIHTTLTQTTKPA